MALTTSLAVGFGTPACRGAIRSDDQGKYICEDAIHSLLIPMRKDSDEIGTDASNLRIIDERLALGQRSDRAEPRVLRPAGSAFQPECQGQSRTDGMNGEIAFNVVSHQVVELVQGTINGRGLSATDR